MNSRENRNISFPLVKLKAKFGTGANEKALDTLKSCRKNVRPSLAGAYFDQTSCYDYITLHNSVNLKQIFLATTLSACLTESLASFTGLKNPMKSKRKF